MPIYEYRCQACSHELETLQFMNEDPLTDCPECGKPELKRKVSAAGFRLKGGGWYETDFKKDKRRNVVGDGESKSSDKPGEGKSETKSGEKGGNGKSTAGDKPSGSSEKKSAAAD